MRFAVVGLDCVLPGSLGADAWIAASRAGHVAIRDVPAGRWPMDPRSALDPRPGAADATPTIRGSFVDGFAWDPAGIDVGDWPVEHMDPLHAWVLHVVRGALAGAPVDRARTDLLVANLSLPSTGHVRAVAGPWRAWLRERGASTAFLDGAVPEDRFHSELPALLAAQGLGLGGHAASLDAACASGLYAVRLACDRLEAGLCDSAVAAAVNRADSAFLFLGFAQLRALSGSGRSLPLDRRGDGLLVGEGAGAVLLKRLDDALADGDVIHAVIEGGGLGNDGRKGNLLAPSASGQLRALRSAWDRAGLDPQALGYVECHATGTPLGDKTEVEALGQLIGDVDRPVVLSSAKALLGHTVTAAGIAGLIRTIGAVRDGWFAPIPCEQPVDGIDGRRFRVATSPEAWESDDRVAAVSAFGFGGTNAHLIVSNRVQGAPERARTRIVAREAEPLAIVGLSARIGRAGGEEAVREALLGDRVLLGAAPGEVSRGFAADEGAYVASVAIDGARFRIPPVEIANMLPQHLLALQVAGDALAGVSVDPARTASIVGMGVDAHVSEHVVRWAAPAGLRDDVAAPLTASRVQGLLPNFVANRLAAWLDLQGPSYAVSAGSASIAAALAHARRLLASGEADAALVGAVDLAGSPGVVAATREIDPDHVPGEAAVMFVVKRLADATRDGDRIHAVLHDATIAPGQGHAPGHRGLVGDCGAADGAVALLKAVFEVRDGARDGSPWLTDLEPRRAEVIVPTIGRVARMVVSEGSSALSAVGPRPAVLAVGGETPDALREALSGLRARLGTDPDAHRRLAAATAPTRGRYGAAVVAEDAAALRARLDELIAALAAGETARTDPRGAWLREAMWPAGDSVGWKPTATGAAAAAGGEPLDDPADAGGRGDDVAAGRQPADREKASSNVRSRALTPKIAFVYPGAGSAHVGMGRDVWLGFPEARARLAGRTRKLRSQVGFDVPAETAVRQIWSSAWMSLLLADVLRADLGLRPDATLGYSLGESAALCSTGAWSDWDALYDRITTWPLFTTDLAGPMTAVARAWTEAGIPFDPQDRPLFHAWAVKAPRAAVEAACAAIPGARVLLINTPDEVVIGGPRAAVEAVLGTVGGERFASPFSAVVHCPEVGAVEDAYLAIHTVPTEAPDGVAVYSAASAAPYAVTSAGAARAIVDQALAPVDWPRLIERAYADGVRIFVEVGPRGACTRWIGRILGDRPHVAVATDRPGKNGLVQLAHAVAELAACGVPVDPRALVGPVPERSVPNNTIVVPHSGARRADGGWTGPFGGDRLPSPRPGPAVPVARFAAGAEPALVPLAWAYSREAAPMLAPADGALFAAAVAAFDPAGPDAAWRPAPSGDPLATSRSAGWKPAPTEPHPVCLGWKPTPDPVGVGFQPTPDPVGVGFQPTHLDVDSGVLIREIAGIAELAEAVSRSSAAMADAHSAFLQGQEQALDQLDTIRQLLDTATAAATRPRPAPASAATAPATPPPPAARPATAADVPRSFDHAALTRFASGKLSECLGPYYADLDVYEPRTRLPTDPLLLVSRVLDVEGTPRKLGKARIVTEYDIPADAWWSHDGKAPPCVIVESGQADLFLVSWLGIEDLCRGERIYRLLDCDLTFHGARPKLGETLRHDIRIHNFARLGGTTLFYFEYDCTAPADGRPVLTMRQGCAGFFTPAELAKPAGLTPTADKPAGKAAPRLLPGAPFALGADAITALEEGRYSDALGPAFAPADGSTLRLPKAPWRLVHRVEGLRTEGGPHGLGGLTVVQELADDDWFNACHFQGDPCMPGTLMFDGAVQAASLWLMAMGFPAEFPKATFEPISGLTTKLRCRGQIVPGQSRVTYEVRVKDWGAEPAPWVIADVVLSVDGTPVVRAEDVGVRIDGERVPLRIPAAPSVQTVDEARLLEFSVGDPSRAFGPSFAVFDQERRVARMPGPPYLTMTRVLDVEGPQGELAANRAVTIAYDVPPEAWWFVASPGTPMCFGVLTEVALQPCGWLTAWQGAALAAGGDVYFRNLQGTMTVHAPVWPHTGTVVTRVVQTSLSRSGGMILHSFTLEVRAGDELIASCHTQFGYFTASALANQKGLALPAAEEQRRADAIAAATGETVDLRELPVVHGIRPRGDLRMLDRITAIAPTGGKAGLGFWVAEKDIDPEEWFYAAHFHQDPVMPGSLGLEALDQLAREILLRECGLPDGDYHVEPVQSGTQLAWKYRGQVPPTRKLCSYEIDVVALDRAARTLTIDGLVRGDGMPIYELTGLSVRLVPSAAPSPARPTVDRAGVAALLDTFEPSTGRGALRLDPAAHPWLRDHCPTVVVPAVPMAFAAEIAAEAATLMVPGRKVVAVPSLEARKWLQTGDGPVDLLVDATVRGDEVDVTLSIWTENTRFPRLSGPVVHMKATVRLGDRWEAAPTPVEPLVGASPAGMTAREYYDGGHTFHGPALQALVDLGARSDRGAESTFHTKPDAELLGGPGRFVLDPLLLDAATHPMMSGQLDLWVPGLTGKLAYPVRAEAMQFFGPRPAGEVRCRLDLAHADAETITFDVRLDGPDGPWCAFTWTEAVVDGGPILGLPAAVRRPFSWERLPDPQVVIGRPAADGWRVDRADLVEPLPGTLVRLYSTAAEVDAWRRAADRDGDAAARIAVKEAARAWLRARIGRDVHPSTLQVVAMRPERWVLTEAASLTAQEHVDHLGPTRFDLVVSQDRGGATARVVPR